MIAYDDPSQNDDHQTNYTLPTLTPIGGDGVFLQPQRAKHKSKSTGQYMINRDSTQSMELNTPKQFAIGAPLALLEFAAQHMTVVYAGIRVQIVSPRASASLRVDGHGTVLIAKRHKHECRALV